MSSLGYVEVGHVVFLCVPIDEGLSLGGRVMVAHPPLLCDGILDESIESGCGGASYFLVSCPDFPAFAVYG